MARGAANFNVELHTRPNNLAVTNEQVSQEWTVDAHEDVGEKMESEVDECPKLLDGNDVCKFYQDQGVAGGAAHFSLGGANNVEFHTRHDNLAATVTIVDHEEVQTIVKRIKRKKCAYGQ